MKINWENRKNLDELYIHDSIVECMEYDYNNRTIRFICSNVYLKKIFDFTFKNVIFCNIQSCNFWGEGKHILVVYLEENEEQLEKLMGIQNSNPRDYFGSQLVRDIKYIQIGIDFNSGDQILIGCESVIYLEEDISGSWHSYRKGDIKRGVCWPMMKEEKILDIDTVLDMLDWNNDIEIQKFGIEEGKKVHCLDAFIRPYHGMNSKSVWENCARILSSKNDRELGPYKYALLSWLADSNCPGHDIILQRFLEYEEIEELRQTVELCVIEAVRCKNLKWLVNLKELLKNQKLNELLSKRIKDILESVNWDVEDSFLNQSIIL